MHVKCSKKASQTINFCYALNSFAKIKIRNIAKFYFFLYFSQKMLESLNHFLSFDKTMKTDVHFLWTIFHYCRDLEFAQLVEN